jgi:hypothetical protein
MSAGIVLESHCFFVLTKTWLSGVVPPLDCGHGPFVAIIANSGGKIGIRQGEGVMAKRAAIYVRVSTDKQTVE